jgi:hypothetical protein
MADNAQHYANFLAYIKEYPWLFASMGVSTLLGGIAHHNGIPYANRITDSMSTQNIHKPFPSPNVPPSMTFGHPHTISYCAAEPRYRTRLRLPSRSNQHAYGSQYGIGASQGSAWPIKEILQALCILIGVCVIGKALYQRFKVRYQAKKPIDNNELICFLQHRINRLIEDKTELEIQLGMERDLVKSVQSDLEIGLQMVEEKDGQLCDAKEAKTKLDNNIATLRLEMADEAEATKQRFEDKISATERLEQKVQELEERLQDGQKHKESYATDMEGKLEQGKKQLGTQRKEFEQRVKEQLEVQRKDLEQRFHKDFEAQRNKSKQRAEEKDAQLNTLRDSLNKINITHAKEISEITSKADQLRVQNDSASEKIVSLTEEIYDKNREFLELRDQTDKSLAAKNTVIQEIQDSVKEEHIQPKEQEVTKAEAKKDCQCTGHPCEHDENKSDDDHNSYDGDKSHDERSHGSIGHNDTHGRKDDSQHGSNSSTSDQYDATSTGPSTPEKNAYKPLQDSDNNEKPLEQGIYMGTTTQQLLLDKSPTFKNHGAPKFANAVKVGIVQQMPYPQNKLLPLPLPCHDPFYSAIPIPQPCIPSDSDDSVRSCPDCKQQYYGKRDLGKNDFEDHKKMCRLFFTKFAALCGGCNKVFLDNEAYRNDHKRRCVSADTSTGLNQAATSLAPLVLGLQPGPYNAFGQRQDFNLLRNCVAGIPLPYAVEGVNHMKQQVFGNNCESDLVRSDLPWKDTDFTFIHFPLTCKAPDHVRPGFDRWEDKQRCSGCKEWYVQNRKDVEEKFQKHTEHKAVCSAYFKGLRGFAAHEKCPGCGELFRKNAAYEVHKATCAPNATSTQPVNHPTTPSHSNGLASSIYSAPTTSLYSNNRPDYRPNHTLQTPTSISSSPARPFQGASSPFTPRHNIKYGQKGHYMHLKAPSSSQGSAYQFNGAHPPQNQSASPALNNSSPLRVNAPEFVPPGVNQVRPPATGRSNGNQGYRRHNASHPHGNGGYRHNGPPHFPPANS